jgi:hypothetical protein
MCIFHYQAYIPLCLAICPFCQIPVLASRLFFALSGICVARARCQVPESGIFTKGNGSGEKKLTQTMDTDMEEFR